MLGQPHTCATAESKTSKMIVNSIQGKKCQCECMLSIVSIPFSVRCFRIQWTQGIFINQVNLFVYHDKESGIKSNCF
jgi:hypothetical protein